MTLLKTIIERSPLPMAAMDGPGHIVRYVSPAFCAIFGLASTEIIGRPIALSIPQLGNADMLAQFDLIFSGSEPVMVSALTSPLGGSAPVNQALFAWPIVSSLDLGKGIVIQVGVSPDDPIIGPRGTIEGDDIRQVNERLLIASVQQHELAAVASNAERRLRELIQGLNAIVYEIDAETGCFTFVSEQAQAFLGYSVQRWMEPDFWRQVIRPDYYERAMAAFELARTEGHDTQHDFPVASADGSSIWLRNIAHVVRDTHGTIVKLRTVVINVTEQVKARELIVQAFNRERAIAQALQYFVLLEEPEDKFDGFSVAALYESALEESLVGGDFFDAFSLPSGRVMLVIGDVTGKGLQAAARTVEVKYALRAYARDHESPADALSHLNGYICDRNPVAPMGDSRFIALSVVVVNAEDGVAQFVSAGAEPPFIVRASGLIEDINTEGMMLGVAHDAAYAQVARKLEAGDIVILTTDGITEARHGLNFFGRDRIGPIVQNADRAMSLHDVGVAIVDAAREHAGGKFQDDVCILLLRRK